MYLFLFLVTGMLCVQVVCSLVYLARKHRVFHNDDLQAGVMIMVPCYNEGATELRKTITSCLQTTYPYENKVMVVVADGMVTGSGEEKSTPEICADILGYEMDMERDELYHYRSLGKKRNNYCAVYSGTYEQADDPNDPNSEVKKLKYMVIVKRGHPTEKDSAKPGNRGKRDSQLVLAGMLNRIHHGREPGDLDMAIVRGLYSLGFPAKDIEYLMTIDADTRVDTASINHMVYAMDHDASVLACCGETQVDNKSQSWVTMIQVFEYYSSHHMKKAFESVFGCVTCLPGCFTMYRIFTEDMQCLIADDNVFQDYSRNDIPSLHEKNLFELGEDRMLTTLLLQHFPGMSLSFVPEAICWTIVPHNMKILLSQRRRWINSTFHNMYELLKVKTMCGICFLSMKMVVICDLIVTMTLPASFLYIGYLAYLFITQPENLDQLILIILGLTFGLQMVSFLVRSRFDYLWWFAVFTFVGVPIFYFILPLYAFTHMDDFSWGKTREVGKSDEDDEKEDAEVEDVDESPTKRYNKLERSKSGQTKVTKSTKPSTTTKPVNADETKKSKRRRSHELRGSEGPLPPAPGNGYVHPAYTYAGMSLDNSTIPTHSSNGMSQLPPGMPPEMYAHLRQQHAGGSINTFGSSNLPSSPGSTYGGQTLGSYEPNLSWGASTIPTQSDYQRGGVGRNVSMSSHSNPSIPSAYGPSLGASTLPSVSDYASHMSYGHHTQDSAPTFGPMSVSQSLDSRTEYTQDSAPTFGQVSIGTTPTGYSSTQGSSRPSSAPRERPSHAADHTDNDSLVSGKSQRSMASAVRRKARRRKSQNFESFRAYL